MTDIFGHAILYIKQYIPRNNNFTVTIQTTEVKPGKE
jgi:hypothetical protein